MNTVPTTTPTDAELAEIAGEPVAARAPWPYASSLPLEEIRLAHSGRRLVLKDLSASHELPRPEFLVDSLREIEIYRDVLRPRELDAPACAGSAAEPTGAWLLLELVNGQPLWQCGEIETWEAAARWLAQMHATPVAESPRLLNYDAAHLRKRFALATALVPSKKRAIAIGEAVAEHLAQLPRSFVHGEFYASNILVERTGGGPRIRPIDWETAGNGPGVLDLAALTAGSWSERERQQIVCAYADACPPERRPDPIDVDFARLLLAAQWSGWPRPVSPPAEHAHDWHSEALELIERLGL